MLAASVPTTTVTTSGGRSIASLETTRTGRRPACSRPWTGSSDAKWIWPRLITPQTIHFSGGEVSGYGTTLGLDLRVLSHGGNGILEFRLAAPRNVFLERHDDK